MDVSRFACALEAASIVVLLAGRSDGSTLATPVHSTIVGGTPKSSSSDF